MSTTNEPARRTGRRADRLLNKWAVEQQTSLDITTIYRKMKAGTFRSPCASASGGLPGANQTSRRGRRASRLARGCDRTHVAGRPLPG